MWAHDPTRTTLRPASAVTTTTTLHEHHIRPRPYVVGYSGYIPGLMFQYGRSFAKAAEDCVVTFLKQQEAKQTTQQNEFLRPDGPVELESGIRDQQIERRCKSLPRMRSARGVEDAVAPTTTFTYAIDENYPPLPGYTGHIYKVQRSTLIGRSVASATRREREKSMTVSRSTEKTQERSVERYQEQTASSRAKQVTIVKPQANDIEKENSVVKSAQDVDGLGSNALPEAIVSEENESKYGVVKSSSINKALNESIKLRPDVEDSGDMVLAGQIKCNDCEDLGLKQPASVRQGDNRIQSEHVKVSSSSSECHRTSTFTKSLMFKSSAISFAERGSSGHAKPAVLGKTSVSSHPKESTVTKHVPPSKSKETAIISAKSPTKQRLRDTSKTVPASAKARPRSHIHTSGTPAAGKSKTGSAIVEKKTITTQTSVKEDEKRKVAQPVMSITTQTSVQAAEETKRESKDYLEVVVTSESADSKDVVTVMKQKDTELEAKKFDHLKLKEEKSEVTPTTSTSIVKVSQSDSASSRKRSPVYEKRVNFGDTPTRESIVSEIVAKEASTKPAHIKEPLGKYVPVKESHVSGILTKDASMKDAQVREPQIKNDSLNDSHVSGILSKEASTRDDNARDPEIEVVPVKDSQVSRMLTKKASTKEALVKDVHVRDAHVKEAHVAEPVTRGTITKEPLKGDANVI